MHRSIRRWLTVPAAMVLAAMAAPAAAHIVKQVGPYAVALGWVHEPVYVGEQNAVQVVVKDANGNPVSDLSADDLKVVVTTAMAQSDPLSLAPTFDEDTGLGIPGDYEAPIIPTAPGDYTFHVTGTIHSTQIDETATSSGTTFDTAVDASEIQFPGKVPALSDLSTRVQRIDARVQSQLAAAKAASSSADRAFFAGLTAGGAGVVIGLAALALAILARRPRAA